VQDQAERKDVASGVNVEPLQLFGRHVLQGPKDRMGAGHKRRRPVDERLLSVPGRVQLGEAEIEQLHARPGDQDVCRLQVAMGDAVAVRRLEGIGNLDRCAKGLGPRQRPCQRLPVDEFHVEIVRADIVQRADVRVVQRSNCACLTIEPIAELLPGDLDRHPAIESRVTALPHFAHPSATNRRDDFVGTEPRATFEAQVGRIIYASPCPISILFAG
jgi:hypothetical protein